jgi:sulfite exporter TauE/SafE
MSPVLALLFPAFAAGALGSAHCVAMCGPMASVAPSNRRRLPQASAPRRPALLLAAQHTGRLASYAAAGAIAGSAGQVAARSWQVGLEALAGFAMVGVGLFLMGLMPSFARIEKLGAPLWRVLRPLGARLLPLRTPWQAFVFGALWGWLPCGLVYASLPLAGLAGSASLGALTMVAFGAGTLPALIALASAIRAVGRWMGGARARTVAGAVVTMLGAMHLTLAADKLQDPHTSCHGPAAHLGTRLEWK